MEEKMDINVELSRIQRELKAPKTHSNSFGRYMYRTCADIIESVKPLLKGLNLTLSDKIVNIGNRYYIEATATLTDGITNRTIAVTAYAREPELKKGMDEGQITGATSSYARKYALNGLFAIDDTKDLDSDECSAKTLETQSDQLVSQVGAYQAKGNYKAVKTVKTVPNKIVKESFFNKGDNYYA